MFKIVKKYQKQVLAVLGVFLMITFVANLGSVPGTSSYNPIMGHIGATPLHASDYEQARKNWQLLKRFGARDLGGLPLAYRLVSRDELMMLTPNRIPRVIAEIDNRPDMFMLLSKEAAINGSEVSRDAIESFIRNDVIYPPDVSIEMLDQLPDAVSDLMAIEAYFERSASNIKVSRPLWQFQLALQGQAVRLNAAEFSIDDFRKATTTAPTTQEVDTQFEKFASAEVDNPVPLTNPFGFGYRFPNRVKLQYISVSPAAVKKVVEAGKTPYQWEVEARRFYNKNASNFPATQPADATTAPANKPFEEVKAQIIDDLISPQVDRLMNDVVTRIQTTMVTDYTAYQAYLKATHSAATSQPATQPAIDMVSSLGPAYNTFEYLSALAAEIQKQTNVLPDVTSMGELKSAKELKDLPGIGKARAGTVDLPTYVGVYAIDFLPQTERTKTGVLSLFQQAQPLIADNGDVYIFRIAEMKTAETPADKKAVLDQVMNDLSTERAYLATRDAAAEFLTEARKSDLRTTAESAKKKIIEVGPITGQTALAIPGYTFIDDHSRNTFITEAFKLLVEASRAAHPSAMIELPKEGKLLVVELESVTPAWNPDSYYRVQLQQRFNIFMRLEQQLRFDWFTWAGVASRTDYRSRESDQQPDTEALPAS